LHNTNSFQTVIFSATELLRLSFAHGEPAAKWWGDAWIQQWFPHCGFRRQQH